MAYPNAFCLKCGAHTTTENKHTVVLQNSARALRGSCPKCGSEVYKILPKGKSYKGDLPKYPNAFCFKCRKHTGTKKAQTLLLENGARAMNGSCSDCGTEVYRILSPEKKATADVAKSEPVASVHPISHQARSVAKVQMNNRRGGRRAKAQDRELNFNNASVIAGVIIICAIVVAVAYSVN